MASVALDGAFQEANTPGGMRVPAAVTIYRDGARESGMADRPTDDQEEVEIMCPRCGYRMTRNVARLRRETRVVCPQCGTVVVPEGDDGDKP